MSVVPEVSLSLADAVRVGQAGISVQGVLQGVSQDDLPDGESWAASDYERKKILSDTSFAELNDGRQFLRLRATYQGSDVKAYTVPVAYLRTAANSGFSILGLPLQTSVLYQGVIASVSTNSFTDAAATWDTGDFATADPNGHSSHHVEIVHHSDASRIGEIFEVTASDGDSKSLSLTTPPSGLVGAVYVIRKNRTLGDMPYFLGRLWPHCREFLDRRFNL